MAIVLQRNNAELRIGQKSEGDAAAQRLWERYFNRLVRLASKLLRAGACGAAEDEEDAALSAMHSFCRGAAGGRFSRLTDRDHVWRVLAKITERKAFDQLERGGAGKRGRRRLVHEPDLDGFAGREPSPDLPVIADDEYERLWLRLKHPSLRRVLHLSLEGYTRKEIAARMGRTTKTVARKQDVIRKVWLELQDRS